MIAVTSVAGSSAAVPRVQSATVADTGAVHVLHVQGNVYMLAGPGVNAAFQIGDEGIVVVDTMTASAADRLVAAIRTVSSRPILQILNTHLHPDHTGGNAIVAAANGGGGQNARAAAAPILAHEHVMQGMDSDKGKYKAEPAVWPTETYFEDERDLFRNGESIQVLYQPNAHTDGDSIVYFRRSDVVVAGDVFTPQRYPVVDLEVAGSINGLLDGLNRMLRITVPAKNEEGGTYVIPGHGHLCDEADVSDYRDMVTIVRDRIQDAINRHMTLEQVKAAKLTRDYDGIYGTSDYTGDMFVEAVYKSLSSSAPKPAPIPSSPAKTPAAKKR
jgi:glyoxylase-like metal-dependent hydrolase (beta-lactamase superfamily II)